MPIAYIEEQLKTLGYWDIEYQSTEKTPHQTVHYFIAQTDDYMQVEVYEKEDHYAVHDCYIDEESYAYANSFPKQDAQN